MKKSHPAGTIVKRMLAILMTIIMVAGLLPDTLSGVLTAWAAEEGSISLTVQNADNADNIHAGDTVTVNCTTSVIDGYQGGEIAYTVKDGSEIIKEGWATSGSFTFDTKDKNKTEYTIYAKFTATKTDDSEIKAEISAETVFVTVYKYYTVRYKEMLCDHAGNKLDDQSKANGIGTAQSVKYGDKANKPADPSKTGYTFDGWVNADGSNYDFTTSISQDTTVYAKFKRNSYTVTFNADGGTPEPGNQTVEYEQKAKEPEEPSKDNYAFDGWQNDGSIFDFNNAIVKDLNLKAKWTKLHKVTFNLGTYGSGTAPTSDPVRTGNKITKPDDPEPKSEYYRFDKWVKGGSDSATEYNFETVLTDEDDNITLTATWIERVKISFTDPASSSSSMKVKNSENTELYIDKGSTFDTSTVIPSKTGYKFEKWYTDKKLTNPFESKEGLSNNTELYAKFTPITYTVQFDSNKGSASTEVTGTVEDLTNVQYDNNLLEETDTNRKALPACGYTLPGYTFKEWNTKKDGTGESYKPGDAVANLTSTDGDEVTVTLYAIWTPNTYKVTYHANFVADGKDKEDAKTTEDYPFTFDTAKALDANTFSRPGYNFVGWTATEDGGAFYTDNQEVSTLTAEDKGNVDLYAQWEDATAPSITFTAREADSKKVADGDLPLANESVQYTIKVTDAGTGVNTDSVQYALPDKDTDTSDKNALTYTDTKGTYDKDTQTYTFKVTTTVQGFVVVKASDNNKESYTLSEDKKTYTKSTGTANTGYSEASALVLEKTSPDLKVTVENEKMPEKSHKITVDVSDSTKPYSGIQKVTYTLKKGETSVLGETSVIDNSQSAPKNLEAIENIKEYTGKEISFDSSSYNGEYTLTVTATDWCGNAETVEKKILYDNTSVAADIGMKDGKSVDGTYYYNASNGDITVKLHPDKQDESPSDIKSYEITLTNGEKTYKVSTPKDYTAKTEDTITIEESDYQPQLGDGTITASVKVVDAANNETESFTTITGLKPDTEKKVPAFFLDTVKPKVEVIMSDGAYFDDDKNYYYGSGNGTLTVKIGEDDKDNENASLVDSYRINLTGPDGTYTKSVDNAGNRNPEVSPITPDDYKSITGSGKITVTVTATDLSQNTNDTPDSVTGMTEANDKSYTFIFDEAAPSIGLSLSGDNSNQDNGLYYYNDGIHNLKFTIGEDDADASRITNFTVTITNQDDTSRTKTYTEEYFSGSTGTAKYDGTIKADDLKALGVGRFSITASSTDRSGNNTSNITTYDGLTPNAEDTVTALSYYLDTGLPQLTVSANGGNQDKNTLHWYHNAGDTLTFTLKSDAAGKTNSANFKEFMISIKNTDTGREKELTQTLTTTDADKGTREIEGLTEMKGATVNSNNETLTLKLSDIKDQLGEGTINITAAATDLSNNTTSVFMVASDRTLNYADENATASFIFDYTAPAITVTMDGTDEHGDTGDTNDFFYKADNAGITIDLGTDTDKAELQNYTVTVSDSGEGDAKKTLTETLEDGRTVKHTGKENETIDPASTKKITFSTEEVAALADGKITVTVTAADFAKNDSDLSGKNDAIVTVTNLIHNGTEATFTLDTVAPVLAEISTSVAGQGPYDADKDYYYKKDDNTTTKFTVVDVNCYTMSIGYKKDGEDQTAVSADKYADNVTLDYNGFTDGKYTDIKLYAHDKAGNALVLGEEYTAAQAEDRDAVDNGDGTVTVTHNRIVDSVAPIATITYSSDATAYLYGDETGDNYKEGTAYINRNLSTQVQISDQYGTTDVALDAAKLTVTENGTAYDNDDQYESGSYDETKTVSAEGSYIYSVFGTDRAGNPVTVKEEGIKSGIGSAEKLSNSQDYKSTENCGTAYNSRYRITIDKTNPTFTFALPKVSGNETVDGTTAYYGSVHKSLNGTFTISEINFDSSRLGAGFVDRRIGNSTRYNQQSLSFNAEDLEHGWSTSGRTSTLTKTIGTAEGIYMYEIQGCDKAGNPVVKSGSESAKNDYTEMTAHGSDAFISHYKVIDTTAPTGTLDIGNYYHVTMNRGGSNTLRTDGYDPYREETHATINITSSDQSPIRINYDIVSTIANTRSLEQNYANDNKTSSSVSGEQVFNIANLVLMDRAGNRSGFINNGQTSANKIYLDVTPPTNYDVEKPVATITSTTKVTRRSADGRDLYNRGVSLGLKVVDPGSKVRSAGLDSIHYTVQADGKTVVDETVDKNSAKAPLYNETSLDYEWSLDLPIHSGGVYETNDIVVTVDAVDNAGNKADTVTYKFGIDTVGPEITVTYDNNSAQHDKYFKENRTATVTVLDRNVDDGKISIKTEAGVPRGYSYASGGGNGAKDIWTKKISYATDGDYTLNISGTDALGNKATVKYVGTATQDFTIDKTKPVITVTFDNNDVRNGKYYKDVRNATVSINEHNFLASEVKIVPSASIQSGRGSQPSVRTGRFGGSGDRHAANVGFLDDGNYSMVVDYTDMAGNEAQQVVVDEFVVDTTAPTIKFNDIPEINGGDVAPVVTVDDTNFSADLFNMVIAGVRRKDHKLAFGTAFGTYGGTASFRNIEVKKENDDIYTITATITDLAGNESEATLKFSVNRFGSTFDYNNKATRSLVNTYYANKEKEVQLVENNVNKLTSHTVLLYWNGEIKTLVEGTDYTVEENPVTGGYSYVYKLNSDNFSGEGIYNVVIQSEDEAGNKNTNSSVKIDGGTESVPVEFQIDKTLPTSSLGGFDTDKYQFNASSLDINVKPTDDVKLASVKITRYDSSGNALGDPVYYSYDEAEIASGRAQDLSKVLDSDGRIAYTVDGYNRDQYLEVVATDAASNNSDDHTYSEPESGRGVIRGTAQRMLVTNSLVAHYTHTPWMIILTIALAGFIVFLIFWKRRKDDDEDKKSRA